MIYQVWNMFKMTTKCLLRSKAFLFFTIALPILATTILNIREIGDSVKESSEIVELDDLDAQVAYLNDYQLYPVKVYDSSNSELADLFLKELYQSGVFQIYRVDSSGYDDMEILKSMENTALKDKVGAIVYIKSDFPEEVINQDIDSSISIYQTDEDERFEMLQRTTKALLANYILLASNSQTEADFIFALGEDQEMLRVEQVEVKRNSEGFNLDVDYAQTGSFAAMLAILSVAFIFSGILILGTIVEEKENRVYTRILLTNAGNVSYLLSKFLIILFTSLLETIITLVSCKLFVSSEIIIEMHQFALITFLMGIIFNALSVCIGIYCKNLLTAMYLAFFAWMITALLGGLYFDISNSTMLFKQIAMIMPQRWALKAAQMYMTENPLASPIILVVTAAYVIVIIMAGILGLRLNRED